MKCLLVSDLHYNLKQFDWLINTARDFEVIIIAGDLLDISSAVSPQAQISVVLSYINRLSESTNLIVCSGNHDLNARNENGEKFAKWFSGIRKLGVPADGDFLVMDEVLFTAYPWWDGPDARGQIIAQLVKDSKIPHEKWIWVYHPPPNDSPVSWDGKKHYGDEDLVKWINEYKPDLVLSGHVHQSPFNKNGSWLDKIDATWVFNPGRQIGPQPSHIIFDVKRDAALWFSLAGAEQAKLNEPVKRPVDELTELPGWLN